MVAASVRAEFEIVTPMFLGDGDKDARIIRPQSFKAELLFWWRALHFSEYGGDTQQALAKMHGHETLLFGGVEPAENPGSNGTARQSAFLLRITQPEGVSDDANLLSENEVLLQSGRVGGRNSQNVDAVGHGVRYLGYGLMHAFSGRNNVGVLYDAGQLTRSGLRHGQKFEVRIQFRPAALGENAEHMQSLAFGLARALKLMGLLGGLGSRKRRGFGSLTMTKCAFDGIDTEDFRVPDTVDDYETLLKALIGARPREGIDFPLSAFAKETQVRRLHKTPFGKPLDALDELGLEFLMYRSWGNNGKVAGNKDRRENFKADHNWSDDWKIWIDKWKIDKKAQKDPIPVRAADNIPERAIFGLPHNYSKDLLVTANSGFGDRRASPLLFHIQKIGKEYIAVATFFDNQFLPVNFISIRDGAPETYSPDPQVILDFLDGNSRPGSTGQKGHSFARVLP